MKIDSLLDDYKPSNDIFSEDDERVAKLKRIIYNSLDEVDRRIIILYAELGSLRKLGKELGISTSSAWIRINTIKQKILSLYA